jgi:hypothetical protein
MPEHAGLPQQPDFELPGECYVYPWGISWDEYRDGRVTHCRARWEEITRVTLRHEFVAGTPIRFNQVAGWAISSTGGGGGRYWWYCRVDLTGNRHATFKDDYTIAGPLGWGRKRKRGQTVRVNIRQLKHIIEKEAARWREGS